MATTSGIIEPYTKVLGSAIGGGYTPSIGTYNPTPASVVNIDKDQFKLDNASGPGTIASEGYTADTASVEKSTVDPATDTVQGQISGIIAANSPLMQGARARALGEMNDRGLLSSNLAIGSAEGAVIDRALPIATPDAATHSAARLANQQAQNTANLTDAAAKNAASALKANATNTANLTKGQLDTSVSLANASAAHNAALQDAQLGTNVNLTNEAQRNTSLAIGAAAYNQAGIVESQLQSQNDIQAKQIASAEEIAKQQRAATEAIATAQRASTEAIAAAQRASTEAVAGGSNTSQEKIAKIGADNRELIQEDAGATSLYTTAMQQIATINASTNTDKDGAINSILAGLEASLAAIGVAKSGLSVDAGVVKPPKTDDQIRATFPAGMSAADAKAKIASEGMSMADVAKAFGGTEAQLQAWLSNPANKVAG